MVQWIAILAVLVCLCSSSLSRSWVGIDDNDYFDSSLSDPDDDERSPKSKYYGPGSWESDEDYEDSEHYGHGYDNDKNTAYNPEYHNERDSHGFGYQNHDHHQFDYHGHDHHGSGHQNHHGHNHQGHDNNKPGFSNWGSGHEHGHSSQSGHNVESHGHPSQGGSPVQPGQNSGSPRPTSQADPVRPRQNSGSQPQNNQNEQGTGNNADRVVFPDFNNQIPTTRSPSTPRPAATTPSATTTTNRALLDLVICIRACPATPEYNPVCGSNNVTYNNPGILQCARNCGVNVTLVRLAPCGFGAQPSRTANPITNRPSTTPTPAQTTRPTSVSTVNPTRFTNINAILVNNPNSTMIPLDLLMSVFGQPPSNSNIDKRKKHD